MRPLPHYSSFKDIKKILLVKFKHIGDVLLATPCLRALKTAFPNALISALVNDESVCVLQNHPLLEEVFAFPRRSLNRSGPGRLMGEWAFLKRIREKEFDLVVDLTSGDRAAWISLLSGARYRMAYDPQKKGFWGKRFFYNLRVSPPRNPDLHHVRRDLGLLESFGILASNPRLELFPSPEDTATAVRALRASGLSDNNPWVLVHPTSRWLFKCWVDERLALLVDWIQQTLGLQVLVTCGPGKLEQDRARHVLNLCKTSPGALLGELSFPQWAALVRKACLFIGVDSAPMHVAASQGTPTLAFFGPTGFQNWRPWGVRHVVLVHDCPCSRGHRSGCDWSRTRACMEAITLEEAIHAVKQLLPL